MNSCPDQSCHENVGRIAQCVEDIKKSYITKATLKWGVGLLISIIVASAIAYGDLRKEVTINTTNYEHILSGMERMENMQGKIWRALRKHSENDARNNP